MRILENRFMTIDFIPDLKYFKVIRLGQNKDYSGDEYKELMIQWRNQIELYQPVYQLIDYQNFYKPIPEAMQKWINENLLAPSIKAGLKRVAFIISRGFMAQVSVEQVMMKEEGQKFYIRYFDNEPDAEKWLFEKSE